MAVCQAQSAIVDADIQKEFARQREHLERSVASLKKKLAKDSDIHRSDNVRIMQVSYLRMSLCHTSGNQSVLFCCRTISDGFCS